MKLVLMQIFPLACLVAIVYGSLPHHDERPAAHHPRPNIIIILIDDQDWVLGGMEPMAITRRLVDREKGATFTNAFVSTPVCCPSRSSILTGKYVHNHGVINNTVSGNCDGLRWQLGPERKTMATYLQSSGYVTFYAGKYLNQYGTKETGGVGRVPPGYDRWVGLVGNSRYYNYTLSVNGRDRQHGDRYPQDYLTDVLEREILAFITRSASSPSSSSSVVQHPRQKAKQKRPFFAMIAPPACHAPFTPAPQFAQKFAGRQAPRWPSFNRHPGMDKHWLLRQAPYGPLPQHVVDEVDHIFRQRWRTLLSVDRMVGKVVKLLRTLGQLDHTHLIVTSDHGYHLGQFTMPVDKRLPYETDIRVPLIIKPAITAGRRRRRDPHADDDDEEEERAVSCVIESLAVVSIDLAPTVLDMAGLPIPKDMDGVSLLPLLIRSSIHSGNRSLKSRNAEVSSWRRKRTSFLIEYHGEADLADVDPQCQQDPKTTLCFSQFGCKCQDSVNNTYSCVRTLSDVEDTLYCHFADQDAFVELYDMRHDPYQLNNTAFRHDTARCIRNPSHYGRLVKLSRCRGRESCFQ